MKIQSLPKELLVGILHYLADQEPLEGLAQVFGKGVALEDVRTALRELAVQLSLEVEPEQEVGSTALFRDHLSVEAKELLAALSPRDERKLLKAFGFLDF